MRINSPYPLLILALVIAASCRQPDTVPVETDAAPAATRLAAAVHAADPKGAPQLKEGFHTVEQDAWRWTERRFVVLLGPPEGAATGGATLTLRFAVPEPVIAQLGPVTLEANVGGAALPAQSYTRPGEYIYSHKVPPPALAGDSVAVEFTIDKALGPSAADQRELAVIFSSVELESP